MNNTGTLQKALSMRHTLDVDGIPRSFTVLDRGSAQHPRDIVLIFHGSRQSADIHRRFTGGAFDALATEAGAVVAYLDGYKGNWNDARRESRFPARIEDIDDVAFTRAVIAWLAETHGGDPDRVFAIGYSNGGQMVMRLLHESPTVIAGAAVIAATMPAPESFVDPSPGSSPRPTPVLLVHGTADPIVPYGGGRMRGWARLVFKVGGTSWSVPRTAEYFAERNGLTAAPRTRRVSPEDTGSRLWVSRTEYRENARPPVELFMVHGGGHTIPGPKKAPVIIGRTSNDISVAHEVARFFGIGTP